MRKQILSWLGGTLSLAGGIFVLMRLDSYSSQLDFSRFDNFMWSIIAGLSLLYGVTSIALALAWHKLLLHFGTDIHPQRAVRIYGLTQLAKYVPGNIMHLASRQAMAVSNGVPGWSLVKASLWEMGLIVVAGAGFAVLVLPQFITTVTAPMAIISYTGILLLIAISLKQYLGLSVTSAFGWYILFCFISAIIFVSLIVLLKGSELTLLTGLILAGSYTIAWLGGLIMPGAPAGIGVREFILVVLLKGLILESDLLLAVLLSRVVTVSGDIVFFILASCFKQMKVGS